MSVVYKQLTIGGRHNQPHELWMQSHYCDWGLHADPHILLEVLIFIFNQAEDYLTMLAKKSVPRIHIYSLLLTRLKQRTA